MSLTKGTTTHMKGKSISTVIAGVLSAGALLLGPATQAADEEIQQAAERFVRNIGSDWLDDPLVIDSIKAQNAKHASLSQADIDTLDQQWRSESVSARGALIDAVLGNALSKFLEDRKYDASGLITEVFVMDNKGLNVGQSDVTSDYWQGDEAKWQKTYSVGPDAVFVDDVEMDESTQRFQTQISLTIADPASGEAIGAVTFGVDAEALLML